MPISLVLLPVAVNLEQVVVGSLPAAMEKSPRSINIGSGPARADTRKDVVEAADGSRRTSIVGTSKIDYGTILV